MPTFGDTSQGGDTSPLSGNRLWLQRATCIEVGTATLIWAYFPGTAAGTSWKGVIYGITGADPATFLAGSAGAAIPASAGWQSQAISLALTAQDYYIGVIADNGTRDIQVDSGLTGVDQRRYEASTTYASPGNITGAGDAADTTLRLNCYVEYTAGGGARQFFLIHP